MFGMDTEDLSVISQRVRKGKALLSLTARCGMMAG